MMLWKLAYCIDLSRLDMDFLKVHYTIENITRNYFFQVADA
jgi:hypothetical protein